MKNTKKQLYMLQEKYGVFYLNTDLQQFSTKKEQFINMRTSGSSQPGNFVTQKHHFKVPA